MCPNGPTPIIRALWKERDAHRILAIKLPGLVVGSAWPVGEPGHCWQWKIETGRTAFGETADSWHEARFRVEGAIMSMIRNDKRKRPSWTSGWTT